MLECRCKHSRDRVRLQEKVKQLFTDLIGEHETRGAEAQCCCKALRVHLGDGAGSSERLDCLQARAPQEVRCRDLGCPCSGMSVPMAHPGAWQGMQLRTTTRMQFPVARMSVSCLQHAAMSNSAALLQAATTASQLAAVESTPAAFFPLPFLVDAPGSSLDIQDMKNAYAFSWFNLGSSSSALFFSWTAVYSNAPARALASVLTSPVETSAIFLHTSLGGGDTSSRVRSETFTCAIHQTLIQRLLDGRLLANVVTMQEKGWSSSAYAIVQNRSVKISFARMFCTLSLICLAKSAQGDKWA